MVIPFGLTDCFFSVRPNRASVNASSWPNVATPNLSHLPGENTLAKRPASGTTKSSRVTVARLRAVTNVNPESQTEIARKITPASTIPIEKSREASNSARGIKGFGSPSWRTAPQAIDNHPEITSTRATFASRFRSVVLCVSAIKIFNNLIAPRPNRHLTTLFERLAFNAMAVFCDPWRKSIYATSIM